MSSIIASDNKLSESIILTAQNISSVVKGLPARAQLTLRFLLSLNRGTLTLRLPDGRNVKIHGKKPGINAELILHNWNLPQKAISNATIGIGESYIDGDWDTPNITDFLHLLLQNQQIADNARMSAQRILRFFERIRHWLRSNTKAQAKKNISAHYDLGNDFYSLFLDETMTYSSAVFKDDKQDLASAQRLKYKTLAEATNVQKGDKVLEIGCGWGGFAEYAAQELDCHVTGLSLSKEQLSYANKRLKNKNLSDKVNLKYQDYRDEKDLYDSIISIEMFEAVGEKYWNTYFDTVKSCLKPGGKAGLQIITINSATYEHYRANPDFIQRFVFPGGMLPSDDHIEIFAKDAGMNIVSDKSYGLDYGKTLAMWHDKFNENWDKIAPLGFDNRFKRLWEFYLSYCEAGFIGGNIDVRQVVYEKPA